MVSLAVPERVEFVDHLEAWFLAHVVDAADVEEVVEAEGVAAVGEDVPGPGGLDHHRLLTPELQDLENGIPELGLEGNGCGRGVTHGRGCLQPETADSRDWENWARVDDSPSTFFCSFMSPSRSASGRGGQPET